MTPQGDIFQNGQSWTASYYTGIGTLWLCVVAMRHVRDWRVNLLGSLMVLGLVLALGDTGFLYHALRSNVPVLGLARYPVKFIVLVLAVAPLLAAFGLKYLAITGKKLGRFEWLTGFALLLLTGVIMVLDLNSPRDEWSTTWKLVLQNAVVRLVCFTALIALCAFLARAPTISPPAAQPSGQESSPYRLPVQEESQANAPSKNQNPKSKIPSERLLPAFLLLIVTWLDLITHLPKQNPTVPPSAFAPGLARKSLNWEGDPELGRSRAMMSAATARVLQHYVHPNPNTEEAYLVSRLAMVPNCNLLDSVPTIDGFFPLTPREMNVVSHLKYSHTSGELSGLLDFMSVSKLTAPGKMFDWGSRPTALPLVTIGQQPVFAEDPAVLTSLVQSNIDLQQVVFLPPQARGVVSATRQDAARVLKQEFGQEKVAIDVQSPSPAVVVISQTYFPAWHAYVDGKTTQLWRANYGFQAVEIATAGQHHIQLRYEDRAFHFGAVLSALGLMTIVGLWAKTRKPFP